MAHVPADARRLQIIKATVEVISKEGAAKTTTRRVAEAAGAPLASLHYTFHNKEELFTAVIEHILDLVEDETRRHVEPGAGVEETVRALFELNFEWCQKEPEFHIAEYELFIWALRTPSASEFGRRIYERWFDVVGGILADSIDAREDPPPYLATLSRDVVAGLDGMLMQMIALGDDGPGRADMERLAEGAMVSLGTPSPPRS